MYNSICLFQTCMSVRVGTAPCWQCVSWLSRSTSWRHYCSRRLSQVCTTEAGDSHRCALLQQATLTGVHYCRRPLHVRTTAAGDTHRSALLQQTSHRCALLQQGTHKIHKFNCERITKFPVKTSFSSLSAHVV